MHKLAHTLFTVIFGLSILSFPSQSLAKAKIQLAILLDSSNSMDGLIDQTRSQLWHIVNYLTKVTKDGDTPILEVALYHYGNDSISSQQGHVRQLTRFTTELDLVSEKLFSIQTNGGQEYAGWAIRSALQELNWSKDREDFRVIFIAGNEPFSQGAVPWRDAVHLAVKSDAIVNTIYCGSNESRERTLWAEGAAIGRGSHFNINQNLKVAAIPTPYDQQIGDWNTKLNQTYIPYGTEGKIGQQRQVIEDRNSGVNLASRGSSKVSALYNNASWDLVDALEANRVKLTDLPPQSLPTEMQAMTPAQRQRYIEKKQAERKSIQAQIRSLSEQREAYIAAQRPKHPHQDNTLDAVIIQSLRQQLAARGFQRI
jgi:hypothetical protein